MTTSNNIQLNESVGVFEIKTPEEFADFLKFERAILYLQVDWSGYEHMSRGLFRNLLVEMNQNALNNNLIPVFKLDCTDDVPEYIRNWFDATHSIRKRIYSSGYGELFFVKHGAINACINYPAETGKEKIRTMLATWYEL